MIKVIALDVYGTILCSDDPENAMPPRQGLTDLILRAKWSGRKLVTSSDSDLINLKLDLTASFKSRVPFGLEVFDGFFQLAMRPKKYQAILEAFDISENELMIIGDDPINDFVGAPKNSCRILVPTYESGSDGFNFSDLILY